MTLRDWLTDGGFFVIMALLILGYLMIIRKAQRERDEAIHAVSVLVPIDDPEGTCRHGIATADPDAAACAYYEDPENLRPAGPGRKPMGRLGTFACSHMSVSNVVSASCGICGPLSRVA